MSLGQEEILVMNQREIARARKGFSRLADCLNNIEREVEFEESRRMLAEASDQFEQDVRDLAIAQGK